MSGIVKWPALALCAALWSGQAHAQTADEIVEERLAPLGGRAPLAKATSGMS